MKKIVTLISASLLGGVITLGSYKMLLEEDQNFLPEEKVIESASPSALPVSNTALYGTNADFTEAAEKTVHAVVHVKNVAKFGPRKSVWENYERGNDGKAIQGAGSGVIITPDGYIVTNNHVISGANEIQVTLNNNKTYNAEVIGTDPKADIALIKVDGENLDYIPFGNSNNIKIGEWVLAVGNPFNLTSTVTAGIVSAKARDLNVGDGTPQSFVQTDAAINPGNSGGALVNINGELIGINTAITSLTGSYVGYGFAVPSNNVRKIVEDIMEYGNVQQGILGIRGADMNPSISEEFNLNLSQGVFVSEVESGSGAAKAGLKAQDIIRQIDHIEIKTMSDLTGYINTKQPEDLVLVKVFRGGEEKEIKVKLTKYEVYTIQPIGLEVTNATKQDLNEFRAKNGVKISGALAGDAPSRALIGIIITKIDNKEVSNIEDVKKILSIKDPSEPISITFVNPEGEEKTYIWR